MRHLPTPFHTQYFSTLSPSPMPSLTLEAFVLGPSAARCPHCADPASAPAPGAFPGEMGQEELGPTRILASCLDHCRK